MMPRRPPRIRLVAPWPVAALLRQEIGSRLTSAERLIKATPILPTTARPSPLCRCGRCRWGRAMSGSALRSEQTRPARTQQQRATARRGLGLAGSRRSLPLRGHRYCGETKHCSSARPTRRHKKQRVPRKRRWRLRWRVVVGVVVVVGAADPHEAVATPIRRMRWPHLRVTSSKVCQIMPIPRSVFVSPRHRPFPRRVAAAVGVASLLATTVGPAL